MSKNYMNDSQASEIVKYISDTMKIPLIGAGGGFAPIGFYGWSADYVTGAPQGWLRCEGQEVNIADYPELATFYASQHGASNYWGGDGITTFAVPDLRGEFIRGAGTNSHTNQGNGGAVGEHQDGTEIPDFRSFVSDKPYLQANRTKATNTDESRVNEDSYFDRNSIVYVQGTFAQSYVSNTGTYTSRPTNTSGTFFVRATVSGDANAHQYSTEEQVVGKWIDGSDIYEITMIKDSLGNGGIIGNIGTGRKIKDGSGVFSLSNGNMFVFSYGYDGAEDASYYYEASTGNIKLNTNIGTLTDISVTIQYTKTQ